MFGWARVVGCEGEGGCWVFVLGVGSCVCCEFLNGLIRCMRCVILGLKLICEVNVNVFLM